MGAMSTPRSGLLGARMAVKQPVQLPKSFIDLMQSVLQQDQRFMAAITGFYEGRNLKGEYSLKITGAQLIFNKEQKKDKPAK